MSLQFILPLIFIKSVFLDYSNESLSLLSQQPELHFGQTAETLPLQSLTCDAICQTISNANPACFTDGLVYQNDCKARCASANNVRDFSCSDGPTGKCELVCKETVSLRRCLTETCAEFPANGSLFCFGNGAVSANECRARCYDNTATISFDCRAIGLNQFTCPFKCRTYNASILHPSCDGQSTDFPVCAKDGLIYDNECQAGLVNQTVVSPAGGKTDADRAECVTAATQFAGVSLSQIVTRWSAIGN
jgi:hypothetical protein